MMMIREGNYVLGLRVGVASLGWAALVVGADNKPESILALGARKFPIGASGDVASGRESGPNERRQEARSTRTRLARRAARMRALWNLLQGAALLPAGRFKERDRVLKALDGTGDGRRPYTLRARALDQPLVPHELGRALYHLAQRRGFQSNRRARSERADEELGVVKKGIAELEEAMRAAGSRTLGEYLHCVASGPLRRRWTSRQMARAELAAIVAAQRPHHPTLTESFADRLAHVMFDQRPLKSQAGRIGRCDLEPSRRRAAIAGLDAQEFRVLCRVNDLRLVNDVGAEEVVLTVEQRRALLELLEGGDVSFAAIRKTLDLPKSVRFNAERIDDEKLIGFRTNAKLRAVLGAWWDAQPHDRRSALIDDLSTIDDDAALARRLRRHWGLDDVAVAGLLATTLEPAYAALSHKAIVRLLPRLRAGEAYATARKALYPRADTHDEKARLPLIHEAYPHLSNPLVRRALCELRVVVNAIVQKYGRPRSIRVALMRELRLGRKARERSASKMRARGKQRALAAARILKDLGVQEPPRWMVDKMLLAEECGWACPFTGRVINIRALVGGEPTFEIAHIVPLYQSLDDSFENKTLCHVSAMTGNRAVEAKALRQKSTLDRFEKLVGPFAKEKLRRIKLTSEEIISEFSEEIVASRLIDTCYTSRLAVDLLSKLYPSTRAAVQATRGAIVGLAREACGLGRIDLPDGSIRQAAREACTVALCGPAVTRQLAAAARGALPGRRRLDPEKVLPWPRFVEDVRGAVEDVVVSARVRKKVSGPLHEETFYRKEQEGYSARKHVWQLTPTDIPLVLGDGVREAIVAQLGAMKATDPRKAFVQSSNLPVFRSSAVRRVRIRRADTLFAVGEGPGRRHVAVERNHHAATLMRAGRGGQIADREIVSQFDAQARLARRMSPVVYASSAVTGMRTLSVLETLDCRKFGAGFQTIRCVSKDPSIVLTRIDDGRTLAEIASGKARIRMSVEQLRKKGARKVVVTPLGEVRTDNT
jgi:CRISPR-associated endonuclease Csn1